MKHFFKNGASSIVLGYGHYGKYIPITDKKKLVKITLVTNKHNEFKTLPFIREIENYTKYYCIPDDSEFKIGPGNPFYEYVKNISLNEPDIQLFKKNDILQYNFIENAGNYELLDTINDLFENDLSFWTCYDDIYNFTREILYAIYFLHNHKICHLDIKPENIIVNKIMFTFKLIDFGFASIEPFDDYANNIRGTPGYFPSHKYNYYITDFFPRIYANDVIRVDGKIPIVEDRKLIYKVDSYCFGRVLFCLTKCFQKNKKNKCCFYWNSDDNKKRKKIFKMCRALLENDVNKRITVQQCLSCYYDNCDLI